nr:alpha-amylase 3, chloroplastic-like isoform X2 [Ipomoea batatas]GMD24223.1 alpha-amylase 3, chloroplastic-like isoform X2 [Ipomoea batatas]
MRPQGSITIKDEETGAWYQHRGMDFKVPLMDYAHDDSNMVGGKKGFGIWTGALGQLSDMLLKSEVDHTKGENESNGSSEPREKN